MAKLKEFSTIVLNKNGDEVSVSAICYSKKEFLEYLKINGYVRHLPKIYGIEIVELG